MTINKLAVYCGALEGKDKHYMVEAEKLGEWLAAHQIDLVYGGGRHGLMGAIARGTLLNGGLVHSVITQELYDRGVALDGVTDRQIVANMDIRKEKMMSLADGMLAFPGGVGTLEEISQAASWVTLGDNKKPVAFYNYRGYYDNLKKQLVEMTKAGFLEKEYLKSLYFGNDLGTIIKFMNDYQAPHHRTYDK
ncbi:TIGR00730 family Rossman fold protein [Limosilactobacillus sp.]|uniref:LOG family protein n=1 Tax=Limosilactobacillus sp. TaxID=2773925 RepID=UPI00345E933D